MPVREECGRFFGFALVHAKEDRALAVVLVRHDGGDGFLVTFRSNPWHAAAAERGVAFEVEGQGAAFADADMLRRVLTNLLDNAVKYGPEGGTVRIEVEPGRLRVRDEGPGVKIDDPFGRFRQGEQVGVKHAGAGLGLAIVQELVQLNGGSVRVEDAERGASFLVELPEDGA